MKKYKWKAKKVQKNGERFYGIRIPGHLWNRLEKTAKKDGVLRSKIVLDALDWQLEDL